MAEIIGVISSVLDLFPVTHDAFVVIEEVFAADRTLHIELGRWEIQSQIFDEWRSIWRDDSRQDGRFKAHAKGHPSAARRILRNLAILAQALTDATGLESRYGFSKTGRPRQVEEDVSLFRFDDLSRDIMEAFRSRAKANLDYIQKCLFVVHRREPRLNALIDLVKECNLALRDNSSALDAGIIMRSDLNPLWSKSESQLERLAEGAAYESKETDEPAEAERYRDLGLAASFLAVVKYKRAKPVYQFAMCDVHLDPSYELGRYETMALLFDYPVKYEKRVVLIEWIRVKDGGSSERRKEIQDLALMLATSKPGTMLLASCYGVLDDMAHGRVGLVLAPPSHIRSGLPRMLPSGTVSALRMPLSLRDLIVRNFSGAGDALDLGIRFKIAQRLLDAVHVMHSTGWLHRNLGLDSIIFFPARERSKKGTWGPSLTKPQSYDFDSPLLVGFNRVPSRVQSPYFSRPEFSGRTGYDRTSYSLQLSKTKNSITPYDLDVYSHPEKLIDPRGIYRPYYDLYSLGVCLLEIGHWNTLDRMLASHAVVKDSHEMGALLISFANSMVGQVGRVYSAVTAELLQLGAVKRDFDCSKMETRLAATLGGCAA